MSAMERHRDVVVLVLRNAAVDLRGAAKNSRSIGRLDWADMFDKRADALSEVIAELERDARVGGVA